VAIRAATAADVAAIAALVASHARRGSLLPRSPQAIRHSLADWLVAENEGRLLGCVSLLAYTSGLVEVRSLAVADDAQGQGIGRRLVAALTVEARRRRVPTLFALTRAVRFFEHCGFTVTDRARFPEKVWRDCRLCPVLSHCDETAMVLSLSAGQSQTLSGGILMADKKINKVVLAYSGGLDTSVIVPWLRENYDCEVICFCANIGQGDGELAGLADKARASGAAKVYIEDLRDEFARDFLFPMLQAGAVYERQYLLGTSVARPLIAKWQVSVAEAEGADAVAHGCTGKGNDQVRFELTYKALNPTLKVIAPWREWQIRSREDALAYAKAHNVPVSQTVKSIYSRDRNLWHLSHEGGILEDPAQEPDEAMYQWTVSPQAAPDEPEVVEVTFERGAPVAVNGRSLGPAAVVERLNELGARHGVGP
jgi:N-acetylglutamate synthase-like GNAT family acetyltransferase